MQWLVDHFSMVMIIGVIAVVGISQLDRRIGSALGIGLWLAIAALGTLVYQQGGGIGIASIRFSQPVFYLLCGVLVVANAAALMGALRRGRPAARED